MVVLKDIVISALLLAFTTAIDESVEEASCDNCGIVDVVVEIVDETLDVVVFDGGSHFTLKFPLSPP